MINLISYQAPLNGEDRFDEPGVAYWFPPLSPSPFSGPKESVKAVCETLRRGGQPAKAHKDVQSAIDFPQAILMTHLLALEAGGWKFRGLREDNRLGSAKVAATQAMSIMAKKKGLGQAWWMMFWRPGLVGMGLRLAPFLVPLDLETYLEYHFTKVRKQTLLFVRQYIAWGQELELPTNGLSNLLDNVEA
jgi:2-dehydropantoate 2-reductase